MSKRWKDLERAVAEALGGRRIIRDSWLQSCPDVDVPDFPGFTGGHCEVKRTFCARIRALGFEDGYKDRERAFLGISLCDKDLEHACN